MYELLNRIIWIDLIKVFAIFSVVVLHTSGAILPLIGKIDFSYWMTGNIYNSMVRMSVPLFFMVSGVLLLNSREETLVIFFKKRFLKVIIPLIAWSLIYIIFTKYKLDQNFNTFEDIVYIFNRIVYSFNRPVYYHLWFLYTILGIYLFLPILKVFIKYSSQSLQIYFIVLWVISVCIIPFINYFSGLTLTSHMPMMSGYIGYFVLGYQLAKIQITKRVFYISLFFIFISTFCTIFGTYILSENADKYIKFFYGNFSVSTLIQAISYFIVLKYIGEKKFNISMKSSQIITSLSISSLGIYLIHPIYIYIMNKLGINVLIWNPIVMVPLQAILVFLLSFLTIFIIQKIPIVKQISP